MTTYLMLLGMGAAVWLAAVVIFAVVAALGEPKPTATEERFARWDKLLVGLLNAAWLWAWYEAASTGELTRLALFLVLYAGVFTGFTWGNHTAAWMYKGIMGYLSIFTELLHAVENRLYGDKPSAAPEQAATVEQNS